MFDVLGNCWEAWSSASELAEAYQLGKMESGAAVQLMQNVDTEVVEILSEHVKNLISTACSMLVIRNAVERTLHGPAKLRKWSMGRFLTHDPICQGLFNRDYTAGVGVLLPWASELTNTPQSLKLMCQRMEADYSQTRPKLRKTWTFNTVEIGLQVREYYVTMSGLVVA